MRLLRVVYGSECGTVDAVPAGVGTDQQDDVANSRGSRPHQIIPARDADAHRVQQWIAGVCRVEEDVTGDGWDAETVPVAADPANDAGEEEAVARLRERPEPERIEDRDRARAHGEDVPDDPADAGGGTLERLDRARVVMGLDLQHGDQPVTDIDRAGVFARPLGDPWSASREPLEQRAGVLIPAVLAPHRAEHAEFDRVWFTAEFLHDKLVLGLGQRDFAQDFRSHLC